MSPSPPLREALPARRGAARGRVAPVAVAAFGRITSALAPLAGRRAAQRLQKLFTDGHTALYRMSGGRVMGWFDTAPILLLTTVGRRSGRERTAPVMFVPGDQPALVASNGGSKQHPQWYRNLEADPLATVQIGRERYRVRARVVPAPERDALWRRAVSIYPSYDRYQRNTPRQIPVVSLHPLDG